MNEESLPDRIARYKTDLVAFAKEVCRFEPTDQQARVMRDMALPGCRVVAVGGNGVGKTAMLAVGVIWHVSLNLYAKAICTAPTLNMLHGCLWAEIERLLNGMEPLFRDRLAITNDRLFVRGNEFHTFAIARKSNHGPELFQGVCGYNILFVVDEAGAVREEVFLPVEVGLCAPDSRMWMVGCAAHDGLFFREAAMGHDGWKTHRMPSAESPLVDQEWIKIMTKRYGKDSDIYRTRVLGKFVKVKSRMRSNEWSIAMREKYVDETYGRWTLFGGELQSSATLPEFVMEIPLENLAAQAGRLVNAHNRTHNALVSALMRIQELSPDDDVVNEIMGYQKIPAGGAGRVYTGDYIRKDGSRFIHCRTGKALYLKPEEGKAS